MARCLTVALFAFVALGCRDRVAREQELEAARRAQIVGLVPADINKDGALDLIVGYGPTMEDKPGTRFSVLEGVDGKTGRVLWTSRLPRWLDTLPYDERGFAVGRDHLALTWSSLDDKPPHDGRGSVSVHELATGRLVWQRTFPESTFWTGNPFRVWTHGELLLVLSNRSMVQGAKTEHVLHAIDFATGLERWSVPIMNARSAPLQLGDTLVIMSSGLMREPHQLLLVDATTGGVRTAPIRLDTYDMPIITDEEVWMSCESWDQLCRPLVDEKWASRFESWLAKIDLQSLKPSAVTLPDGTPQALGSTLQWIGRYNDSVIAVEKVPDEVLRRFRAGDRAPSWTYRPGGEFTSAAYFSRYAAQAPDAAYLRNVPGRYLPLFVSDDEASRLVILDLDTGAVSWQSKPFTRGAHEPFIVRGTRYYANLPAAGNALLAINANNGKVEGVYQIAIGDVRDSPTVFTFNRTPNPWHFQGGMLVGHWGGAHYWMIDLNANKLRIASPGVTLLTPWQQFERVLGPVPRTIAL